MTLRDYLKELSNEDNPVRYSGLLQLSGLSSEEVCEFKVEWPSVPRSRTREIMGKLVELREENVELDFSAVFVACLGDADEDVRERATRGLWECEDRGIIRPLIGLLQDDPSARVRAAAGMSLRTFADMAQNGRLLSRDGNRVREALIAVIDRQDEDLEARRRAIEAVASFEGPEIDQIILDAYHSGNLKLRQSSIHAMGRSSNTQWLPTILEGTDHAIAAIRYESASACGLLGEETALPHLIQLIQDEDVQVQLAAVKAIGATGGPLAKQALQRCLRIGDEALEEAARYALKHTEFDDDPLGFTFEA